MKQTDKDKKKGSEGFEEYYSSVYGERWPAIRTSFFNENQSVEYKIPGAEKSYFLDSASVLAALCLPVENAENLLDLCAAPGGKTLVLASRMKATAVLSSNERSPERKHRLSVVTQTCLPEEISSRVRVSCSDGATWCTRQTECFDAVLLDSPCSSERHVIADPKYLNSWSLSRIKTITMEQWALLSSAYRLLSPGGYLLYSTCAITPKENDEMMEKLVKKFNKEGENFIFEKPEPDVKSIQNFTKIVLPVFEQTKFGYQIMPDTAEGAGPIYFSLIKKIKSSNN